MIKNPPSNAGDMGSIPNQGNKIPHAVGYLSPHATATEPTYTGACVSNQRITRAATEIPCAATKTNTAK